MGSIFPTNTIGLCVKLPDLRVYLKTDFEMHTHAVNQIVKYQTKCQGTFTKSQMKMSLKVSKQFVINIGSNLIIIIICRPILHVYKVHQIFKKNIKSNQISLFLARTTLHTLIQDTYNKLSVILFPLTETEKAVLIKPFH